MLSYLMEEEESITVEQYRSGNEDYEETLFEKMDRIYQMIDEFRLKEFDHEMDPVDYWGKLQIKLGKFL